MISNHERGRAPRYSSHFRWSCVCLGGTLGLPGATSWNVVICCPPRRRWAVPRFEMRCWSPPQRCQRATVPSVWCLILEHVPQVCRRGQLRIVWEQFVGNDLFCWTAVSGIYQPALTSLWISTLRLRLCSKFTWAHGTFGPRWLDKPLVDDSKATTWWNRSWCWISEAMVVSWESKIWNEPPLKGHGNWLS